MLCKLLITYSNNQYGLGMTQPLSYAVIKFDNTVWLEKILSTPGNSGTEHVMQADLNYTDQTKNRL